ncbi:MAG: FtsX-like permease family protein [Planctomycetes bacterium]|nr:FtsX-like permease family protein [Planctomycetota bacterium]
MTKVYYLLLAILVIICAQPTLQADSTYSDLMAEFSKYPHRLASSENFNHCLEALEAKLKAAGLESHRQVFKTIVPETIVSEFIVNGKPTGPLYPLGPNGAMPVTTGADGISGQLLWLGDGSLKEMAGKPVEGCIALLNFNTLNMQQVFSQGAKAVIFLGDGTAQRWQVGNHFTEIAAIIPRFYMSKQDAQEAGLLEAASQGAPAKLNVIVTWKNTLATNLWLEIPGEEGALFNLSSEEALVLSATLDTFGTVPELCPQLRSAANVALLAEVCCKLAKQPLKRSIYVVFLGSHYGAQDGARHFYYGLKKGDHQKCDKEGMPDPLDFREAGFREELAAVKGQLEILQTDDFLKQGESAGMLANIQQWFSGLFSSDESKKEAVEELDVSEVVQILRRSLDSKVNNRNYEISRIRLKESELKNTIAALEEKLEPSEAGGEAAPENDQPLTATETTEIKDQIKLLTAKIEQLGVNIKSLKESKSIWNNMRRQLISYDITDKENFAILVKETREELMNHRQEAEVMLQQNLCFQEIAKQTGGKAIVGHFTFDFANDTDAWMFSPFGDYRFARWITPVVKLEIGNFSKSLENLESLYQEVVKPAWEAKLLSAATTSFYQPRTLSVVKTRSVPSSVPIGQGIYGYQLMTVGIPLDDDELPISKAVNLEKLSGQLETYLTAMATSDKLSLKCTIPPETTRSIIYETNQKVFGVSTYYYKNGNYYGERFRNYAKGSSQTEGPSKGALVFGSQGLEVLRQPAIPGHTRYAMAKTNGEGYYFIPEVNRFVRFVAFEFDKTGVPNRFSHYPIDLDRLFFGQSANFYIPFNPNFYGKIHGDTSNLIKPLNANSDSRPKYYWDNTNSKLCAFAFDQNVNFKFITNGFNLLGSTKDDPMGVGFPRDPVTGVSFNTLKAAANDFVLLNSSRLDTLRKKNIVADSLEVIHAEAVQHLDNATTLRAAGNIEKAVAHETFSMALSNRVYKPLKDITTDLVQAVVLLLILNIPFAFVMERLLCGFISIYKQIFGFIVFFVLTFIILYYVHPAFSLASAPVIIFLAFVIILISALVIYLVMTKFRKEVRAIQGLASTVHGVASDSSTALASVAIGIAGMRNRPLKTFLTSVTVVLLTFTILVFASFTSKIGVTKPFLGKGPGDDRIELHRFTSLEIPERLIASVKTLYEDNWNVFRRGACYVDPTRHEQLPAKIIYNPASGKTIKIDGILGFEPGEVEINTSLKKLLPRFSGEYKHPPLFVSELIAASLEIKEGETLNISGRDFTYAGTFDTVLMEGISNLDGTKMAPPDFTTIIEEQQMQDQEPRMIAQQGGLLEQLDLSNFVWFHSQGIAITNYEALEPLEVIPNQVVLYPKEEPDFDKAANELANIFAGPIYAKSPDGLRQYFFTTIMEGSGFSEILVPLVLGALIIFSSLLGSIVDREREIFTYSALGLAPPDVGALFFAESSVYAVVGGLGGYLFSQVVAKVLAVLASYGYFHPPEMNFSSFNSVLTIFVVMAAVLLSTIYPAIKASRSANPGVARKWKMPKPEGNSMRFLFPFTVSAIDMAGILSFIKEHFQNHSDASLGSFAAKDVSIFRVKEEGGVEGLNLGIQAMISLAPFDLGVFQEFKMYSRESEIAGIMEVVVELHKINGSSAAWLRGNRTFINDLRNQFLLWRSLPVETLEVYREQTSTSVQETGDANG